MYQSKDLIITADGIFLNRRAAYNLLIEAMTGPLVLKTLLLAWNTEPETRIAAQDVYTCIQQVNPAVATLFVKQLEG